MKHVERRHFYVRDMVEKFEINVPFVRTDDNIADFFTKPLCAAKFFAMRRKIMNEAEPEGVDTTATSDVGRPASAGTSGRRSEGGRPSAEVSCASVGVRTRVTIS